MAKNALFKYFGRILSVLPPEILMAKNPQISQEKHSPGGEGRPKIELGESASEGRIGFVGPPEKNDVIFHLSNLLDFRKLKKQYFRFSDFQEFFGGFTSSQTHKIQIFLKIRPFFHN